MYPCETLCSYLEKSTKIGTEYAKKVEFEFLEFIKTQDFKLLIYLANILHASKEEPWYALRKSFLNNPNIPIYYTQKFYEILTKYNYHKETEIIECITALANSQNPQNEFSFWTRCPWINNISYNEKTKMYTIKTDIGDFSFIPIFEMYQEEVNRIRNIGKIKNKQNNHKSKNGYDCESYENFDFHCHFVSYEYAKLNPYDYALTAICPNCFPGSYWLHSYNISYNRAYVIDIANSFVMSIDDFERLFKPKVLDETKGEDLPLYLAKIKESNWPFYERTIHTPLKTIAFYSFDSLTLEERRKRF